MTVLPRFTSSDLALMPEDGKRYEVIDGELCVTHQPSWHRQFAASRLYRFSWMNGAREPAWDWPTLLRE